MHRFEPSVGQITQNPRDSEQHLTILPVGLLKIVEPSLANRHFVSKLAAVVLLTFLAKEEVAVIGANIGTVINATSSALLIGFISEIPGLTNLNQGLAAPILTGTEGRIHIAFMGCGQAFNAPTTSCSGTIQAGFPNDELIKIKQ